MSFNSICARLLHEIDGARASVVIDTGSHEVLGHKFRRSQPRLLDTPSALVELLEMSSETSVRLGQDPQNQNAGRSIQNSGELHIATPSEHHFVKLFDNGQALLVVVASRESSVALVWAQLNAVIGQLELERARHGAREPDKRKALSEPSAERGPVSSDV